jgi:hypothetical protein
MRSDEPETLIVGDQRPGAGGGVSRAGFHPVRATADLRGSRERAGSGVDVGH